MTTSKNRKTQIARSLNKSKFLKDSDRRLARAVRWRLNAYVNDPKAMNLVRPLAAGLNGGQQAPNQKSLPTNNKMKTPSQYRFRWGSSYYEEPVRNNVVFYESFSGNGALCNPRAIFDELLNDPDLSHLEHVWTIRDEEERRKFNIEFARDSRVKAVKYENDEYWREICTAKYLVNNATFPPYFTKRKSQVYINAWHGTPLKKMGYHANEGATGARNIIRNFVQADYLVSPNSFTTNVMYLDAYKMHNIYQGKILEVGYPRVDAQFSPEDARQKTIETLRRNNVSLTGKPVVLYAPTWKGESFHKPINDANELADRVSFLREQLGDEYDVIIKVHQQVFKYAKDFPELADSLVDNSVPTNKVLAITDILVSDYSSIFFDYLASQKPIIFFTPDKENYSNSRGLYEHQLPGPVVQRIEDVADLIGGYATSPDSILNDYSGKILEAKLKYCAADDGNATRRLIDIVFKNSEEHNASILRDEKDDKKKILLYLGGMRNNGITTSGLNLLSNIDYQKYDVSIWAPQPSKDSPEFLFAHIPPEVRQFLRQGTHPLTEELNVSLKNFLDSEVFNESVIPAGAKEVFDAEWRRSFGDAEFDYVVDFSGYAGYWSFVLLQAPSAETFSVWQHNDVRGDRDREVNGKKPHFASLTSQFNSYRFFDNIVSVSEDLRNINRDNLGDFAEYDRFRFAHNTVNSKRIKNALSGSGATFSIEGAQDEMPIEDAFNTMLKTESPEKLKEILDQSTLKQRIFHRAGVKRFVTAGRMSPEKNQARLIRAFAEVRQAHPDTELVILGDGPLRSDLEKLTRDLNLESSVHFTGMVSNALSIMKECDCFVLSSDYEGQPMVILEASSLALPVVAVAFASVRNSLDTTRGIVVEQDDQALAEGMIKYLNGEIVQDVHFDIDAYNRAMMDEFYESIGATQ